MPFYRTNIEIHVTQPWIRRQESDELLAGLVVHIKKGKILRRDTKYSELVRCLVFGKVSQNLRSDVIHTQIKMLQGAASRNYVIDLAYFVIA